jgi:aminoglycoside phosphotransferase (APT) family kinase protein
MNLESDGAQEARSILREHRIDAGKMELAGGFANQVLMTPEVVIRLNEGRFPQAFAHEERVLSHLPDDIPHPRVLAAGHRAGGGEYLVLERLPGERLDLAWGSLTTRERERVAGELAAIVQRLHALPAAGWMQNPWVEDVLRSHRWRDAYRPPPGVTPLLIESARGVRPDQQSLLDRVAVFVDQRMPAFGDERDVFLHTDLHFRNLLVDRGRITGLIDFEGSRRGPADVELDMFLRSMRWDSLPVDEARGFIRAFRRAYPAPFAHSRLVARLEVYEALWHLVQFHHWKPGDHWTSDPAESLAEILDGSFAAQVDEVLGN